MKLYVCGPMTGIVDFNYPAFDATEKFLQEAGYETLNPTSLGKDAPIDADWTWFMRGAIQMVAQADAIALLDGWQNSRGAKLEVSIGEALGIPIYYASHWEKEAKEVLG